MTIKIKYLKGYFTLIICCQMLFFTACSEENVKDEKPPNILFCLADDAMWKHFGAYGSDWVKTPNFDKVAKQGLLFNNAYTPDAKCGPSRSVILTGRNPWQLEEAANHNSNFPKKFVSVAEALHNNGYHVGYTGKGWAPGNAGIINGKKRDLLVQAFNQKKLEPPTSQISDIDYAANFKEFLGTRENKEPFFFWYGGNEPHRDYEYGSGIEKGGKSLTDIDSVFGFWPDVESIRTDMLDYAFEIEHFDKQLGKLIDNLEVTGELENTIIIVTSDNGMPFPRIKGHNYEYSNHMPLAIMWGKNIKNPGREINDYISFTDFAATFTSVSKIEESKLGMLPIEGESLEKYFESDKSEIVDPDRNFVLLGRERNDVGRPNDLGYPIRGIVKDNYLYIKNFEPDLWPSSNPETGYTDTDGSPTKTFILNQRREGEATYWNYNFGKRPLEELYDLSVDRDCMDNLAGNENYLEIKNTMFKLMTEELTVQKDPRVLGNGDVFNSYPPATGQGFYERYMNGETVKSDWINKSDFEKEKIIHSSN